MAGVRLADYGSVNIDTADIQAAAAAAITAACARPFGDIYVLTAAELTPVTPAALTGSTSYTIKPVTTNTSWLFYGYEISTASKPISVQWKNDIGVPLSGPHTIGVDVPIVVGPCTRPVFNAGLENAAVLHVSDSTASVIVTYWFKEIVL